MSLAQISEAENLKGKFLTS